MGLPAAASAHGVGDRYDLPAPLAHFIVGATATVALSFLVTALVAGGRASSATGRGLVVALGPLAAALRRLARLTGLGLFALVIWAGFTGDPHPVRNIAPTLTWVGWWVGLSLVTALVGNVWGTVDPWRALFDGVDALVRRAGGRGLSLGRPYPEALGVWPAVILLLALGWVELVDMQASVPRHLAVLALAWSALTLAGMIWVGPDRWQARADPIALSFATLGRFAPLGSLGDGRRLVLRPLGRGLLEPTTPVRGRAAFVVAMLATVLFDGLLGTKAWRLLEGVVDPATLRLDREGTALATLGLAAVWLVLLAAFSAACRLTARLLPPGAARTLASDLAPALVPIVVAYHVAHNLGYVLVRGQDLVPMASDPLGRGWNLFGSAGWTPDPLLVGARFEWYVAVGAVVTGHVISIWLAHRLLLRPAPGPRGAALAALPLTTLMIGYTALSLWVIADPLVRYRTPDPSYSRLEVARSVTQSRTMRSISTAPPRASAVTPTVVRAGSRPGAKWAAYSAFTAG